MNIAYITAGAAGMYCGSCIHDNTLAAALIRQGHQVTLVPTYTPTRTDESSVSQDAVFYGAINVYLQEKSSLFRHTPRVIDWILNRPGLVRWATRFSSSTSAQNLGALTVSILQGSKGHQSKELTKLIDWLATSVKPDLLHLTNSMFLGLAREARQRLDIPVLCSLQGEDLFLEDLIEPYHSQARELIAQHSTYLTGFVSPTHSYATFMSEYLQVPREKIHVVPLGLNLKGHGKTPRPTRPDGVTTIGYLARICPEKGLHLLVEAFDLLVERLGKDRLRLEIAGYLGAKDQAYFETVQKRISDSDWSDRFRNWGEVDRRAKIDFLSSLDMLSVPTLYRDPKGLFILEALANQVPVVQPAHGSFPELIEQTGGGILVQPDSAPALADGLQSLVEDTDLRAQLASQGKDAVTRQFSDTVLAENAIKVYQQFL